MENTTTLRIDLGIQAQKIASQIMINNENIESQIIKGIQQALEELQREDNFVGLIKEKTKESINESIRFATNSWEFRDKLTKAITERLDFKIKEYADSVAEKVLKDL